MSISLKQGFVNDTLERCLEDLIVRFVVNCPEEDLASYERVLFQIEEAHWFYLDYVTSLNPLLQSKKMKPFTRSMIKLCPIVWKWGDPEVALSSFGKYKSTIPVRGCALLNEQMDKLLLVKGIESNSWGFPRGKISKDEKDVDCAVRELEEETGFDASDSIDEDIYIERTLRGKNYKIYIIRNVNDETKFEPKAKFEIVDIKWHNIKKLNKSIKSNSGNYFLVNSMLKPIMSHINSWKNSDTNYLKKIATQQLKQLLGIGIDDDERQQSIVDPGRDLLSFIQNAAKKHELDQKSVNEEIESNTTDISTTPTTNNNSKINSFANGNAFNAPMFNNSMMQPHANPMAFPQLPFPPNLPFMSPFFPPNGFGAFPFPMAHPMVNKFPVPNPSSIHNDVAAPSASSLRKPNFRSKVSNSKELLSILTSKITSNSTARTLGGRNNDVNNSANVDTSNKEGNKIAEKIRILQRPSQSAIAQRATIQNMASEAATVAPAPQQQQAPVKILKRGEGESNASQLMSILKRPSNNETSSRSDSPSSTKTELPTSSNEMGPSNQLMNILKRPETSDQSPQLVNILKRPDTLNTELSSKCQTSESSSSSAKLMNILKRPESRDRSSQLMNILMKPSTETVTQAKNQDKSVKLLNLVKATETQSPIPISASNESQSKHLLNLLKNPSSTFTNNVTNTANEVSKNDSNVASSQHLLNMLKKPVEGVVNSGTTNNDSARLLTLLKNSKPSTPVSDTKDIAANKEEQSNKFLNILQKPQKDIERQSSISSTSSDEEYHDFDHEVQDEENEEEQDFEDFEDFEDFDHYDDEGEEGVNVGLYVSDSD